MPCPGAWPVSYTHLDVYKRQAPYYEQAKLVFLCRKLYRQDMTAESFLQPENLKRWYPQMDLHRMFVGEIVKVLERK